MKPMRLHIRKEDLYSNERGIYILHHALMFGRASGVRVIFDKKLDRKQVAEIIGVMLYQAYQHRLMGQWQVHLDVRFTKNTMMIKEVN